MRLSRTLAAAALSAAFIAGCSQAPTPDDPTFLVAEGSDVSITRDELNTTLDQFLKSQGTSRDMYAEDQLARLEAIALDQLILEKIVLAKAAGSLKLNAEDIEREADVQFANYKDMSPSKEAFDEQLRRADMTEEGFREDVRNQVVIAMALDQLVPAPPEPQQARVEAFYKSNEDRFQRQHDEVRASHVLVKLPAEADEETQKAAKAKIDAALARVKAGEDFSVVASQVSEDRGSATMGGDLDFFRRGEMVPEFEEVAFNAETGTISDVFVTPFGYHFLKVTDKHSKGKVPLTEVRPMITKLLQDAERARSVRNYLDKLQEEADVTLNIDLPEAPAKAPMPAKPAAPQVPASTIEQ